MCQAVGGDILADGRVSLNDGVVTNMNELVKHGPAAKKCFIAHLNVSSEQHVIRDYVVIAHGNIVREVNASHKKISFSDQCISACNGATMDGDIFTQGIATADHNTRLDGGIEMQILWVCANDRAPTNFATSANLGVAAQGDVAINVATISNLHGAIDDGIGSDVYIVADVGRGINYGSGMNVGKTHGGRNLA